MDSTAQTTSPPAHERVVRIAVTAVPLAVVLFAFLFVFGIGGLRGGWLWAPLVTAPPAALLGWFGWGPGRGRVGVTVVVVVLAIAYGSWIAQNSILSHGRLRAEMDAIAVPAGFDKVGDQPGGWSLCFDVCTDLTRTWRTSASPEEVTSSLAELLRDQGFVLEPWAPGGYESTTSTRGHRGRLGISMHVRDSLPPNAPAPLVEDEVAVSVTLDTYSG